MARRAPQITVSERQRRVLDKLERSGETPQQVVPHVRIVKLSGDEVLNKVQSADLEMTQETIGRWRGR